MKAARLEEADCRVFLKSLRAESVDAVVTDPPYELDFMGKSWDRLGLAFQPALWSAVLRVLKPGGYLLAFGGSRTWHRIACAIEDAGFEVRDCLSWMYGTGFPKSLNVGDGRGTALKPAWEPVFMARKPLAGTVARNLEMFGTGALNIDACRIGTTKSVPASRSRSPQFSALGPAGIAGNEDGTGTGFDPNTGRWPANVCLDEEAAAALDEQTGILQAGGHVRRNSARQGHSLGAETERVTTGHNDSGGASRFFYVAKASRSERDTGCESLPERTAGEATDREDGSDGLKSPRAGAGRTGGAKNHHATVKPVALMRWLVRLVTPPGGLVLDPFTGSGTTGVAALQEGRRFIGCERSPEYVPIARARLDAARRDMEQPRKGAAP